ncbi:unnamed protein product [Pleuronectes platessa]|uniref:Uncharacterized protein n=1 Tax=Pleuronectes platessa TaxID=8262 RepID=A0A9N7VLW5_PLEPL|nr:unnamed protein product [Pleuronectes platessa]
MVTRCSVLIPLSPTPPTTLSIPPPPPQHTPLCLAATPPPRPGSCGTHGKHQCRSLTPLRVWVHLSSVASMAARTPLIWTSLELHGLVSTLSPASELRAISWSIEVSASGPDDSWCYGMSRRAYLHPA